MEPIGPKDVTPVGLERRGGSLWSSYNGERKGDALADVLLGAYNPSGRRGRPGIRPPESRHAGYAIRPVGPTGRTYMYFNGPLSYPFGYGLSYSNFTFANMSRSTITRRPRTTRSTSASTSRTRAGPTATRSWSCTRTRRTPMPSLQRPIKRLMAFQKVGARGRPTEDGDVPAEDRGHGLLRPERRQAVGVDNGLYGIQISTSSADADIQESGAIAGHRDADRGSRASSRRGPGSPEPTTHAGSRSRSSSPRASTIDPGLTVSMNDDSLYGWIGPGGGSRCRPGRSICSHQRPSRASC